MNEELYYVQPDGSWKKNGDGRSKGLRKDELPKGAKISEEAPANNAGSGNIAGIGVGPNGEPGVKKTKYKIKNQKEAPGRRLTFAEFIKGRI